MRDRLLDVVFEGPEVLFAQIRHRGAERRTDMDWNQNQVHVHPQFGARVIRRVGSGTAFGARVDRNLGGIGRGIVYGQGKERNRAQQRQPGKNCVTCCLCGTWHQKPSPATMPEYSRSSRLSGASRRAARTARLYFEPNRKTMPAEYRRLFSVWFTLLKGSGT